MRLSKTISNFYEFTITHASGSVTATSVLPLQRHKWYHLIVTYDGGVAGRIRLYHANTYGAGITASDCVDATCMVGSVSGTIGKVGGGERLFSGRL